MRDDFTAWSFDRAVFLFGTTVDAEIESAGAGARNARQATQRRQRALAKWVEGVQVKYADPGGAVKADPKDVTSGTAGSVTL